ncbi:3128_t:CDS:2 [Funneliformis geosporum]|uniref:3128_t:CDS:1 n=1 Tax=Funneliformis geosporum TaxID=1117311 RepID=A0A9W4SG71_9GLOM|nr:3128_t:CDS:2 [Funneliformis geosporum]
MSNNKIVGPDTSGMPYFTLTANLTPQELASASTALLDAVNSRPKLTQAYRMEVKFLQNSAEFRICLDTVVWYDCYLRVDPDLNKVVEMARKYISTTRREIPPDEDGPFVIDYQEIEKEKAYIRCTRPHNIKNPESKCKYDHPTLICNGNVITRDGRETTCNYYFPSKLTVQELSTKEFVILLRREPIRELLMLPLPIKNKDNFNHFDNETLVKNSDFWSDLLKQQQSLTFYSIALNYGRWETQQSHDKYAQACHAHVHLYFNRETWESLKNIVKSREIIAKMNARKYPGPNYLLKDCMELEQQRLQSAEHQNMLNINNSLVNTINNNFNSLINTINNNNNTLVNAIEKLSKKLDV